MVFLKLSRARQAAVLVLVVLALGASVLSAGCGQKGPLYVVGDPTEIKTNAPQPDEDQTEDDDDEEETQDNR